MARRLCKTPDERDPDVLEQTLLLALDLEETKAIEPLRLVMADRGSPLEMRTRALTALVERHVPGLASELHGQLDDRSLRGPAIRALAAYNDTATPQEILKRYPALTESERDDVIATLSARPAWALACSTRSGKGRATPRPERYRCMPVAGHGR